MKGTLCDGSLFLRVSTPYRLDQEAVTGLVLRDLR